MAILTPTISKTWVYQGYQGGASDLLLPLGRVVAIVAAAPDHAATAIIFDVSSIDLDSLLNPTLKINVTSATTLNALQVRAVADPASTTYYNYNAIMQISGTPVDSATNVAAGLVSIDLTSILANLPDSASTVGLFLRATNASSATQQILFDSAELHHDSSPLALTIALADSAITNDTTTTATITRSGGDLTQAITVTLSSSDTGAATVPASVIIAANQTVATVTITPVVQGIATITATSGAATVTSSLLTVSVPPASYSLSLNPIGGAAGDFATLEITRQGGDGMAVSVAVASSDTAIATVANAMVNFGTGVVVGSVAIEAISLGTATISVTHANGTETIDYTVDATVSSVEFALSDRNRLINIESEIDDVLKSGEAFRASSVNDADKVVTFTREP